GDAHQIVDLDPLADSVLSAGAWSVRDGRHTGQPPETVAIIHKGFWSGRQRSAAHLRVRLLKNRHQGVAGVQPDRIANEAEPGGHAGSRGAGQAVEQAAKLAFDRRPRRPRQPAARALQPALLRILIVNLAAVDLTDEDALAAGQRI